MDDRMEVLAEGETRQPTPFRRREVSRVPTDMWSDIASVGSNEDAILGLADRLPFNPAPGLTCGNSNNPLVLRPIDLPNTGADSFVRPVTTLTRTFTQDAPRCAGNKERGRRSPLPPARAKVVPSNPLPSTPNLPSRATVRSWL